MSKKVNRAEKIAKFIEASVSPHCSCGECRDEQTDADYIRKLAAVAEAAKMIFVCPECQGTGQMRLMSAGALETGRPHEYYHQLVECVCHKALRKALAELDATEDTEKGVHQKEGG